MIRYAATLATLIFLGLVLIGCTSVRLVEPYSPYIETRQQKFQNYKIGQKMKAFIGESIIEKGNIIVQKITSGKYKALCDRKSGIFMIRKNHLYDAVYIDQKDGSVYVKAGLYARISGDGVLLDEHPYYYNLGGWQNNALLHVGKVGEKLFDRVENIEKYGRDSFKIQIIYSGLEGNNLKVTYREYKNDIARPAFYQDIVYNLNKSHVIRYRNFKIKILKATNEELEYIVLED